MAELYAAHQSADFRAHLIGRYLMLPNKDELLPDEVIDVWREFMREFIEQNPDHPGLTAVKVPNDPAGIIDALRPHLEPGLSGQLEISKQVSDGRMPYGMLSVAAGKPYALTLVMRGAGCLPINSIASPIFEDEVAVVESAIGRAIAADLSALRVCSLIRGTWPRLLGEFRSIGLPIPAKADLSRSIDTTKIPSVGTLGWDAEAGISRIWDRDTEAEDRIKEELGWMMKVASDLDSVNWSRLASSPEIEQWNSDPGMLAWLVSFDYAAANTRPFYADDLGLRNLARGSGVQTFGSTAPLTALLRKGRISHDEYGSAFDALRENYCVDLPLDHASLLRVAERSDWRPAAAAFAFSRPAAWIEGRTSFEAWADICKRVGAQRPDSIGGYCYAAIVGLGKGKRANAIADIANDILYFAVTDARAGAESFPGILSGARTAVKELGEPLDPLSRLIHRMLRELSDRHGRAVAAQVVLAFVSGLADDDRGVVRMIALGPDPW